MAGKALVVLGTLCLVRSFPSAVLLLYSPATPFNFTEVMNKCCSQETGVSSLLISSVDQLAKVDVGVVLDYLYDPTLSTLAKASGNHGKYFKMWGERETSEYLQVFSDYVNALNLTQVFLIGDTEGTDADLVESLYQTDPKLYRDAAVLPIHVNLDVALQFVGKQIKSQGINLAGLFLSPQTSCTFLKALELKKLNKAGFAFILSQTAGRYRYLPGCASGLLSSGLLIIAEEKEREPTQEGLEAARIRDILQHIATQTAVVPHYSLFYMKDSELIRAASRPSDISPATTILFPGNTTVFPKLSTITIPTSVNYNITNMDGSLYPLSAAVMRGFELAFEEVNSRSDILPHHHVQDISVDLTRTVFNYNYSVGKVQANRGSLGLIHMPAPASVSIMGLTKVFTDLNITIPMTTGSQDSKLSDPGKYPLYLRTRPSGLYVCTAVARMIEYFGWSHVAYLYGHDGGEFTDAYQSFLTIKDLFHINVTNPEPLRALPPVFTTDLSALNASLQAILESTTRVIIITHIHYFMIMEMMYDLGVAGDYVLIFFTGLSDVIYKEQKYFKRRVVSKGALQFFPRLFEGKVGENVHNKLLQRDGKGMFGNTCLYYDCAYLYFHATDDLIHRGVDYEDPHSIIHAMRNTYFHGCSGFITIDQGSNDRAGADIVITNFQYFDNDTYQIREVGSVNPFSIHPYQITSPIQWPDDSVTFADIKPNYLNCTFLAEVVRTVPIQHNIALYVNVGIGMYTLCGTVLFLRKWSRVKVRRLKSPKPLATEDVLVFIVVACDYFQLAAMGPDLEAISGYLQRLSAGLGLDLEKLTSLDKGVYWVVMDVTMGVAGCWVVLCILAVTGTARKLCECYMYWTELLLPAFGNILFLPIIYLLSSVFLCDRAISDRVTDSFPNKDCSEFCWREKHLGYAIGSGICLLLYLPLAIYTRPMWQELQTNVHIQAKPRALMVKAVLQVFFTLAVQTARNIYPEYHAYFFFSLLLLYLVYLLFFPFYNYERLNLWQIILTVGVLSLSVTAHICAKQDSTVSTYLLPALFSEYAVLLLLGFCLQLCIPRFKSKLYREKNRDLRGLFTFAFTGGKRAQEGLKQFYTANGLRASTHPAVSERDVVVEIRT